MDALFNEAPAAGFCLYLPAEIEDFKKIESSGNNFA
ncbi:hypothetical protein CpVD57_1933 [Corynebacterium pseudotuberculosis]|nr:Hypothetical protein CpPAT10_1900a [Corynebacterium pseudotuberculosis PAT10]AFF23046.1 Hypothetical protein CpP54B96_1930 [Corynebacterium pseudotuberculosis P54B96]AFH52848.1 Hypothetical protein Cp267_1971 [Corynebacterium pseudotuberculosis 267]AJC14626.1 hypothetical protein CpVD57_1933 [Corynebacterium pseudotuberculosis]AKJ56570.1 Hypothetical protein Cp12C_1999 [Corynebacterium pseudotuberculosis]